MFAAGFLAALLWRARATHPAAAAPAAAARPSAPPRARPARRDPAQAIVVARDPEPPQPNAPAPRLGGNARLAILVDDLGNDSRALSRLLAIPEPVSGAVLPGLPRSAETARALFGAGKEVLLHLPMEPVSSRENPGPGLLKGPLTGREVAAVLAGDLEEVPHAVGVNNHMGSKGTADARLMDDLMAALRARGLYFVDSRTTEWTRAGEAARRHGVPFLSRNVFLDDVASEPAVAAQLERAAEIARTEGSAVAIGHPHGPTLSVLEKEMPRLRAEGVTPVFVSELIR